MRIAGLFFFICALLFADAKESVQTLVDELKAIEAQEIESIVNNPFAQETKEGNITVSEVAVEAPEKKPPKKVVLQWTINERALINNVWYKEGDIVSNKKIVYIGDKGIILSLGGNRREIIRLKPKDNLDGFEIGKVK